MKIAAPVSSVEEVAMLLHCGADELYCGVSTPEWEEHFGGQWWMNRRSPTKANLVSWNDTQEVVRRAHEKDVAVHLTLNAPFYPEGSLDYLLKLSEKVVSELHIDSLIVSDINFLLLLQREQLPVRIHLSSLGGCFNARSADFYSSLGVSRIILPRQLRLREIKSMVNETSAPMEFEVFALNDGCFFEEGFCQTSHTFGPFCLADWETIPLRSERGRRLSQTAMKSQLEELRTYLWFQNNCGSSFQEDGLPNGPCSLCWFGHFRDWNITAVKIAGREASFHRKMASLQLVKAVMDEVRSGASVEELAEVSRSLRKTPGYCTKGYMCYFRDP